ncbi:MAG: YigZ family protein [Bacteroidia bacterium]|nr:YigZ family protein [Bacteroidia bacterium]
MLFDDSYHTIKAPAEGIYKEKGSKFIGYAFPVKTEADCKEILLQLKKEHHSARHHCYAYRLGPDLQTYRANDDGEPNNTAGKPILGQIQSKGLTNILIVVVRYFGGTLLGVGGLIVAYRSAAAEAIANAEIVEEQILFSYSLTFNYENMNDIMRILKENHCKIISQDFGDENKISFSIRKSQSEKAENSIRKIKGIMLNFGGTK